MVKPNETNEILYFMIKSLGKTQRNQRNLIFYNYDYYYYYYYYVFFFFGFQWRLARVPCNPDVRT